MDEENGKSDSQKAPTARQWPLWRKVMTVAIVASFSLLCTLAASMISPGRDKYQAQFNLSTEVSVLPFSLYNLGLAWGTILGSPMSERFGRQRVFLVCMPLLLIFVMGTGFSKSLASLLVTRTLGGLSGSAGITIASATIADLFAPGGGRAAGLFIYYSVPFMGAVFGPFLGYFIVIGLDWQWTQWIYLFFATPMVILGLAALRETKESVLEKRHTTKLKDKIHTSKTSSSFKVKDVTVAVMTFLRTSLFRPLHMLFTELVVGPICVYAGFNFGLIYALVVIVPDIFKHIYGFSYSSQALSFLGLIGGCLVGPPGLLIDDWWIRKQNKLYDETSQDDSIPTKGYPRVPEYRLRGAMFGGVMLPIGLFWFAWTFRPDINPLAPIFATSLITLGGLCVYVSTSSYVIEVYGPKYSASANGASSMVRYTMAGVVPLFILPMYDGLGVGWATSLLGFCAVLLMPIPWIFSHWGHILRERCRYNKEDDEEESGDDSNIEKSTS